MIFLAHSTSANPAKCFWNSSSLQCLSRSLQTSCNRFLIGIVEYSDYRIMCDDYGTSAPLCISYLKQKNEQKKHRIVVFSYLNISIWTVPLILLVSSRSGIRIRAIEIQVGHGHGQWFTNPWMQILTFNYFKPSREFKCIFCSNCVNQGVSVSFFGCDPQRINSYMGHSGADAGFGKHVWEVAGRRNPFRHIFHAG